MFQTALKYNLEKTKTRRVEFPVPFSAGEVFVISEQPADNFNELLAASQSRLDFWDNSFDDEDWNQV
ncbi:MAG: hypothetical protein VSS75_013765 [Candidatus Parabeggiatoa sp.]|nr:hypothetical protein [Candidatus Parabeggiatoa sp.]